MGDILDTRFEGKEIDIEDNIVTIGDDINIMQKDPLIKNLMIGAGWDVNAFESDVLDLDLSAFFLNFNGVTRMDSDFLYFNNRDIMDGQVKHNGDSRTGAGDGDDESISINLQGVPFDILRIVFVITIYKGDEKAQSLNMVRNAYIRVLNMDTTQEILRYNLKDVLEEKNGTTLIVGSLNREGPKWHFTPLGEFSEGGLKAICEKYGLIVGQY